ncbi:hypothetical protein EVAR_86936_1 [Eumeta japonica]|uniref:Uncharacterized protein n=1 Tax=Eumeta variegata TaxID=151549 RepID=A0A4C1W974_EUMVA|nr:hypothetical protein EVAR_86936_1 [Eumeta japonica]
MLWLRLALASLWVLCVSSETAAWSWGVQGFFELESALFLNEATVRAPEAGYKLHAKLALRPYWSDKIFDEHLLELHLEKPVLMLRGAGKHPDFHVHHSRWDELHNVPFYVQWRAGVVLTVHVDARLEPDLVGYLKSLASLLQIERVEELTLSTPLALSRTEVKDMRTL